MSRAGAAGAGSPEWKPHPDSGPGSGPGWNRAFSARLFTTWQPHYIFSQPGAPDYEQGNVAFPNVVPLQAMPAIRSTLVLNMGVTDNIFVNHTERYRAAMTMSAVLTDVYVDSHVKSTAYADLGLNYRFLKPGNEIFGHVRNLFDKMPQHVQGLSAGGCFPLIDDVVGRFYTAGVRIKLQVRAWRMAEVAAIIRRPATSGNPGVTFTSLTCLTVINR